MVAATYLAAVGHHRRRGHVADARREHMETLLRKVGQMGADLAGPRACGHHGEGPRAPVRVDVATLPYPGVATDY